MRIIHLYGKHILSDLSFCQIIIFIISSLITARVCWIVCKCSHRRIIYMCVYGEFIQIQLCTFLDINSYFICDRWEHIFWSFLLWIFILELKSELNRHFHKFEINAEKKTNKQLYKPSNCWLSGITIERFIVIHTRRSYQKRLRNHFQILHALSVIFGNKRSAVIFYQKKIRILKEINTKIFHVRDIFRIYYK